MKKANMGTKMGCTYRSPLLQAAGMGTATRRASKYISSKRKIRKNVGPLLDAAGTLVTQDTEKTELLNAFFTSVFASRILAPEIRGQL
ncbi:hypothetical protein QYF61_018601 [Mycteria americana]|uniref:Uncharacterized protein n=1 Tax=Mycteria americana TaxID=33587 RepID=A0AAN7RVZ5_MYCAM|nr:hypothetical protein QYF61_018601 [Mycteria americana]